MHILHALFTPSLGGIEQAFINISRVMVANGHQVTAMMRHDAPYASDIAACVSSVHSITPSGFYDVKAMFRIRRILKELRPDVILAHAPRAIALMGYASMGLGIPVCGMLHSYRSSRVRHANRLVVLTEHLKKNTIENGYAAERISVVPNMILMPERKPEPRAYRKPFSIGAMGRLVPEKGFDRLIDAVSILHRKGLAVRLHLAGTGKDEDTLRHQVQVLGLESQVVFEGWVQDKNALFEAMDVFCLPSLEESFGIVLLEAMIRGVPIITTDTFGPLSIFTAGKDALMVPKGDVKAMADAIEMIMRAPEVAAQLAEHSWQRVQEFSKANVGKLWNEALVKTLAAKAGPTH